MSCQQLNSLAFDLTWEQESRYSSFFLHNLLRSRAYSYPSSSVSGQFYPVFPSREFLLLAAYTDTFVLVAATCQLKLAVFAFSIYLSFTFTKPFFIGFYNLEDVFSLSHSSIKIRPFLPQEGFIWLDLHCSRKWEFSAWTYPQVKSPFL